MPTGPLRATRRRAGLMEWRSQGVLLSAARHGETSAILQVFTPDHGRHAGIVRGGASRKMAPVLQPGAQLDVAWQARLAEHLGTFRVEPIRGRAAEHLTDRMALAALAGVCALLAFVLPERQAMPRLYAHSVALLDGIGAEAWGTAYVRWELALLEQMGFGLDLGACAVSGATDGLAYVSPRTGRAVTAAAAGDLAPKLLPLPQGLARAHGPVDDLPAALSLTGHFLARLAASLGDRPLPAARGRLVTLLSRD